MIEWREIPSFPNYEASNTGYIRRKLNGRILQNYFSDLSRNYKTVCIFYNKKRYTKYVARLVWEAFNDCACGMTIDHIDRDSSNNHINNLRCVSHKVNSMNRDNYSRGNKYNLSEDDKKTIINKLNSKEWTTWMVMKKYNIPTNYTGMILKRGTWNKYLDEQPEVPASKKHCN